MNILQPCRAAERRLGASIGGCVIDLRDDASSGWRTDESFPTASVIKIPILMALFERVKRDRLDLREEVALRKRDVVGGSGILKNLTPGISLSLRDLAVLMVVLSDNTATNLIIDFLGLKAINASIRSWGYEKTTLWRKVNFKVDISKPKWLGESSPAETADMLVRIARREFLGKRIDAAMEEILAQQKYDTALPRLLPGSGDWDDENPEIVVAHKTGSITGVRVDAGIVTAPFGRYVIALYVKGLKDNRYHPDNAGILAMGRASRSVYHALEKKKVR